VGFARSDGGNGIWMMTAANEPEPDARERIVRAASELFYRDGISASGVDALIGRANVAKATFYRHFPSKEDLIIAWLRGPNARWSDQVIPEVERRRVDPVGRLVVFWDVLGDWLEEHDFGGCPFINTLVEIRDPKSPARREVDTFVHEVEAYFARTAADAGLPEPAELARRLRFVAMGLFVTVRLEPSRAAVDTARRAAVDLLATWLEATPQEIETRVAERRA
jgi:AcrR family transcriptional regulator